MEFTGNLWISPEITFSRENLGKPLKAPQRVAAEIPKILLLLIGDPSMARAQTHLSMEIVVSAPKWWILPYSAWNLVNFRHFQHSGLEIGLWRARGADSNKT